MPNYKEMYFELFREVKKVIEQLQEIQKKTEELYMEESNVLKFSDSNLEADYER